MRVCVRFCLYIVYVHVYVNVLTACIYIVLLIVNDRRIHFYNIMQLVCVIKYILEFDTLVKTVRRAIPRRTFVLLPSVVHEHDHCIRSSAVEFRIFYIRGRSPSDRRRSARLRFGILLEQLVYFSSPYVTRVGVLRFEGVSKFSSGLRT